MNQGSLLMVQFLNTNKNICNVVFLQNNKYKENY